MINFQNFFKRVFDLSFGFFVLVLILVPMIIILLIVYSTSSGPILHWSKRVGVNNKIFKMPKFRSMLEHTPEKATHLLEKPSTYLSPVGGFLRRYSFDELPQLYSILKGDMSFVGPRPALFNQDDLISLRTKYNINTLLPGVTGWAQVNGRDNLSIEEKVKMDLEYFQRRSLYFDLKIILMTFFKVFKKEGVSH
jgi:O-antigen biosynthesis protein WbqP